MKKRMNIYMASVMFFSLFGCAEDIGNYKYTGIVDVEVSFPQEMYSVIQGDTLKIYPEYKFSAGYDASDFSYSWEAIITNVGAGGTKRFPFTEKDPALVCPLTLPANSEIYKLYLCVTENSTGLSEYFSTPLEVTSSVSSGWMVLCDDEGEARLDMISMSSKDTVLIYDILSKIQAGVPALSGPVSICTDKPDYCLNTRSGSYYLDKKTLMSSEYGRLDYQVFSEVPEGFYASNLFYASLYYYVVSGEGNLYSKSSMSAGSGYGEPINVLKSDLTDLIPVSSDVAYSSTGTTAQRMVYDTRGQRFLLHKGSGDSFCQEIRAHASHTLFDYSHVGKDLVRLFCPNFKVPPSKNRAVYALFRDAERTWLYVFEVVADKNVNYPQHYVQELPAETQDASLFAVYEKTGWLYYVAEGKIRGWNPLTGAKGESELVVPAGYKVSLLKYISAQKALAVGIYPETGGNKGELIFYTADEVSGKLEPTGESYAELGKVVDILKK